MNPKERCTRASQWSATQNGTYWTTAHFLAHEKYENKTAGKKHKAVDRESGGATKKSASTSCMHGSRASHDSDQPGGTSSRCASL